jgi:flagellar capping protein FliD
LVLRQADTISTADANSINPDVLTALISASAAVITAVVALALNHRGFNTVANRITSLDNRMTSLETRIDNRFTTMENRLDRRLESIESDLKEFFKPLAEHDKRVRRLEDKQ